MSGKKNIYFGESSTSQSDLVRENKTKHKIGT